MSGLKAGAWVKRSVPRCVGLLAVVFWCFTTDRFGCRTFICTAHTTVVLVLFLVGSTYYAGATWLVLCCFWNFGYSIVSKAYYLFSAELSTAVLRVKTVPITFCANSIMGIGGTFAIPPMLLALNIRTAFVFGAFSAPISVCLWLFLPETRGHSAAEIDELYERKIPAWRWAKTVTAVEEQMHAVVQVRGEPGQSV